MNCQSGFVASIYNSLSAEQLENGQADVVDRPQTYTQDLQRESSQFDIVDSRQPLTDSSQEENVQDDPIDKTCSEPTEGNEKGKEGDTVDRKPSHTACSPHNVNTNLMDKTLFSADGSQQKYNQNDVSDNTNSGRVDGREEGHQNSHSLPCTHGDGDDSDITTSKQQDVNSQQDGNDKPDALVNTKCCKTNMQEQNDQSYTNDNKYHNVADPQEEKDQSDVFDTASLQDQIILLADKRMSNTDRSQVNTKLDLCDNIHAEPSDTQEVMRRCSMGSDMSDTAENQGQKYSPSTQRENDQFDLLDDNQSCTAKSPDENDDGNITNSNLPETADLNDESDQSHVFGNNQSCTTNNVQEENDRSSLTYRKLPNSAGADQENDKSDNTNSGRVDGREEGHQNSHSLPCTHGDGDDSDITTSKQQDVNSQQDGNDKPDALVNTKCCKTNMQEQNDQSYTNDNKYHNVADPQEEKDQSDVFDTASLQDQIILLADKRMSNTDRSQVNTKLDLCDNIHAEPSDTQEVMRRCSMGSDLPDTAENQGQKYSPSTQRENDQFDLLDDNQSCTAKSPDENDDGNITNSNLPETADLNDESDQSHVFGNNQSCTTNNVQEENDRSSLTYRKLPNSAGADQENDKSDNTNSGRVDGREEGHQNSHSLPCTHGDGDDSDITTSKQQDVNSQQDGNDKPDALVNTKCCKTNMQEQNDQSYTNDNKYHNVADPQEEKDQSDVFDTASLQDQIILLADKRMSNTDRSQVNTKLDLCDNIHAEPSDTQEVMRRCSMGSDLPDTAENQGQKYSPSTQRENDQFDLLDDNQSCTAKSPDENDDGNITNSNLPETADLNDESDQSHVFGNNQSCTTNNVQEENDRSSLTYRKLPNSAGADQENDKSDNTNSGRVDGREEGHQNSHSLPCTHGDGDDSDITTSKQQDVNSQQDGNDKPDALVNTKCCKANMQEQNDQSYTTDNKYHNVSDPQEEKDQSDVFDTASLQDQIILLADKRMSNADRSQVNTKLDLCDNIHAEPSDTQEVMRRCSMGSDMSDTAENQGQKYSPSTQRENDRFDLLDDNQSCTAKSPDENDDGNITNSNLPETADLNDESDQSHVFGNNQSCTTNNVQEENDRSSLTYRKLPNSAGADQENDKSDNTNSGRVDGREEGHQNSHSLPCTHGDGDDSDITTSKQQDVNSQQDGNDKPDALVNTKCCKTNMQEQNDQSYTNDNKYHNVADPQEEKDQSDVFDTASLQDQSILLADKRMSNTDRSQVNTKLDLCDNIHAEPSDTQEVMRRCSMGSDLPDTAENQGQKYSPSTQRENDRFDLLDDNQSCTAKSPDENDDGNITNSNLPETADLNDESDQSHVFGNNQSCTTNNVQEENDRSSLTYRKLPNSAGADQENDKSDNTNSGRVDGREEGHQNSHSLPCTHGDGDDSDITTSKQQDVNSQQGGNDQPDALVNTKCCKTNMQEQNDQSFTNDNKYHNVADPQEEKDQSDVFDTASLQDQSILLADKRMSNTDRSQVNTKLDLCDNIHAEPSDTQEVMRRCSMGSDLSDTAENQGQKYSPSTQRENDRFDHLDDNQSCTAKSPDENDDGNITNSNLPETADLNDESDQSHVFGNNQSCTTNNVQEENDRSSLTYRKLPNSAGADQENDKSDLSDNMQLCTFDARDHHIDNHETAIQQHGEIGRQFPMGVQQMRPGHMDVNVNKATVIGNKNKIIQGNPEEHSETLNAISASTDQMTDEQEKQTTNLKQEIHGTERRLTRVIADEGSNITATVTNTGHETKERVHSMHESMERKQGDMEMQLAKMKQQNAVLLRDTEENTSYNVNKSTEAQKEAIEQSVSKTTVNIVKEIDKVKADVYDTEQKMLSAVNRQAELLQEEIVHMRQKLANDMKQSGDEITKCIHTAQDDTIAVIEHLKESMDSLRRNHAEEMAAFQQTFTNQMAELQRSMISSNKYHKKAIDKVSRQVCHLQKKIDCMDGNMEELALETTVTKVKNVLFDRVCKSVKSSEKRLLDAIYD